MAGDNFKVNVYASYNVNALDQDTNDEINKVPANHKTSTGTFQIWREVHLAGYLKKKRNVTAALHPGLDVGGIRRMQDINITQMQQHYNQAYIRIADRTGGIQAMTRPNFVQAMTNIIVALPWYIQAAIVAGNIGVDQYDNSDDGVVFKDHPTYVTDLRLAAPFSPLGPDAYIRAMAPANINPYAGGVHNGGPTPQYPTGVKSNLWKAGIYPNAFDYEGACKINWGRYVLLHLVQDYLGANRADGIYVVQMNELDNFGGPNGFSVPFLDQSPNSSFIAICGNKYDTSGQNTREQTLAHEMGHTLGLNHTDTPAGDPRRLHDNLGKGGCLMSYNFTVARIFCGSCLLRLRGWSIYQTDANGVPQGTNWQSRTLCDNPECNKQPGGLNNDPDVALQGVLNQNYIDQYKLFNA